ncbi:ATP-binding protein [Azospirillum griseum]|uniref:histidine kinase n=1 Tax=Azospirillum griseum TaxID=2496639 RepID=A0A431VIQ2_9PROT|nr:ATP-binding protein [Azospirillum griseum]RTR20119.1 HAMP domain-containing protein [Azospirillum griseum]
MPLAAFSQSLVARTTASAALLASMLIAVPMVILIQADVRATRTELAIRAELATKIVLDDVANALWDLDPEEAQAALAPLRSVDAFAEAAVLGSQGERFTLYRRPGGGLLPEAASTTASSALTHMDRLGNRREIGTLLVRMDATPTNATIRHDVALLSGIGVGILLLVVLGVVWAARGVTAPIAAMTRTMTDLAAGDVTVAVPGRHRGDEIGRMATALRIFRQNAIDLRQAKERAEQAVASKAKFMAAASHDLRQPAQSLLMLAALLRTMAKTPDVADTAQKIEQVVMNLKQLLDELLEVSRLDAGGVTVTVGPHEISDLFQALDSQFGPVARGKGLTLTVSPLRASVATDRVLLLRLLGNLIDNAIRYTATGSIQVVGMAVGSHILVEVRDTGIGIPDDRLDAIWEEFHQLGNPERNRDNGIGLGLSIVKRLAGILGHPVKVRSVLGKGSVFSVTVPVAAAVGQPPEPPTAAWVDSAPAQTPSIALPPAPLPPAPPVTVPPVTPAIPEGVAVLVIDDDPFVLNGLSLFLANEGHRVHSVSVADHGVRDVQDGVFKPDVIVADYHLSATDTGLDFINRLWMLLGIRIPAVLISGRLDSAVAQQAREQGITVVPKPIMPERLSRLVKELPHAH